MMTTYLIIDEHSMRLLKLKAYELSVEWRAGERDDVERRKEVGGALDTLLSLAVPVQADPARIREIL